MNTSILTHEKKESDKSGYSLSRITRNTVSTILIADISQLPVELLVEIEKNSFIIALKTCSSMLKSGYYIYLLLTAVIPNEGNLEKIWEELLQECDYAKIIDERK